MMMECPKCGAKAAMIVEFDSPPKIFYSCGSFSEGNKSVLVHQSCQCKDRHIEQLERTLAGTAQSYNESDAEVRQLRERLVMRAAACLKAEVKVEDLEQRIRTLKEGCAPCGARAIANQLHPRVLKFVQSGKRFIVIGVHESYFIRAYQMIREQEVKQGTWTLEDDKAFAIAHEEWIEA